MNHSKSNIFLDKNFLVSTTEKENKLKQKGKVLWFTGLSGSGKSTIAKHLEKILFDNGYTTCILDGDNIRSGLNNNLSFTPEDRLENIRRISETAKLFIENGIICICCFVSPTESIRSAAKNIIGESNFMELFVDTPIEICEARDVKGLYKKARAGEIKDFTGINAPFNAPKAPFYSIKTTEKTPEESAIELFNAILEIIKA